jgi:hypothetical protein
MTQTQVLAKFTGDLSSPASAIPCADTVILYKTSGFLTTLHTFAP